MHRDPANFSPPPEAFLPERWLPSWLSGSGDALGTEAAGYVHNEAACIPFSYGPTDLAYHSQIGVLVILQYLLATLLMGECES